MFEIMKGISDKVGQGSFFTGLLLSIGRWLASFDFSLTIDIMTIGSLGIGIVYYLMRAYQQYLETKRYKKKRKEKSNGES